MNQEATIEAPIVESLVTEPAQEIKQEPAPNTEVEQEAEEAPKQEKTPEQKELARERRRIANLTRQKYELQARLESLQQGLQKPSIDATNDTDSSDSEELTLSKGELKKLVESRAKELAPTISQQAQQIEQRRKTIEKLSETWGQEKFESIAEDLDAAVGGLMSNGRPTTAADAIFAADDPAAVIEYLADPENAADAETLASLSPIQAGKLIARLEARIEAKSKENKPQRSKAPAPIEPVRGAGTTQPDFNQLADDQAWYEARQKARKR